MKSFLVGGAALATAIGIAACGSSDAGDNLFGSGGAATSTGGASSAGGSTSLGGSSSGAAAGATSNAGSAGTSSSQGGTASGGSGTGGTTGCGSCDDGIACTVDTCSGGSCHHEPGPSSACPKGQSCDVLKGCVATTACTDDTQCAPLAVDPCKAKIHCDLALATCVYVPLDKDGDGHPPVVCGGDDCDDTSPDVHPGATELCDGKDQNCNGTADDGATCPGGGTCSAGVCGCPPKSLCAGACVDFATDPKNCGSCGSPCGAGQACQAGKCQCSLGVACGNKCVDTSNDAQNCGGCNNPCPSGVACKLGKCACPGTETACGAQCVDTLSNPSHCGTCTNVCSTGVCTQGKCGTCPVVDLFLLQDLSGSMLDPIVAGSVDKRTAASQGIKAFLAQPATAAVEIGIGYFPKVTAQNDTSCVLSDYPVDPIAPAAGNTSTIGASLDAHATPNGSTSPQALQGTFAYVEAFAQAHPTHKVVVVLITDGLPNWCPSSAEDPSTWVAAVKQAAASTPSVGFYGIELTNQFAAQLAQVSAAAGTPQYIANSAADVTTALQTIRDATTKCN